MWLLLSLCFYCGKKAKIGMFLVHLLIFPQLVRGSEEIKLNTQISYHPYSIQYN
jgi:hypothetical protein